MEMIFGLLKKTLPLKINGDATSEKEAWKRKCRNKSLSQILQEEYQNWIETEEETARIELDRINETEAVMYFTLGDEGTFQIQSPPTYPFSSSPFQVKTDCKALKEWTKVMNEFIEKMAKKEGNEATKGSNAEEPPLCLSKLLTHCASTYLSSFADKDEDAASEVAAQEEHSEDFSLQTEDVNLTLEILAMKKRWLKKEAELRSLSKSNKNYSRHDPLDYALPPQSKKVNQIFSNNGAAGVLMNDLLNIMKKSEELGISAEPVDDNIYEWKVKLFRFDAESELGKQLKRIKKKFHYDYVELNIKFTMDLYPFYPPLVKLIRPRFHGFMMGRVTCMDILKLSHWDPVKDMTAVLSEIRDMMIEVGRLDVDHPSNSMRLFPEGAYTELEFLLLRLELLSEQDSRESQRQQQAKRKKTMEEIREKEAVLQAKKPSPESELDKDKKTTTLTTSPSQSQSQQGNTYWAKGTGYGHANLPRQQWDVQAYLAAQKEKDVQTEEVLRAVLEFLNKDKLPPGQYEVLEESCLIPVLESYLRNDSLLDMGRHAQLYIAILGVVKALSKHESLLPLLDLLPLQSKSVFDLLKLLKLQSEVFVKRALNVTTEDDVIELQMAKDILTCYNTVSEALKQYKQKKKAESMAQTSDSQTQVPETKETSTSLSASPETDTASTSTESKPVVNTEEASSEVKDSQLKRSDSELKDSPRGSKDKDEVKEKDQTDEELFALYSNHLRPLQFDTVSMRDSRGVYCHHYATQEITMVQVRDKILRLAQEQSSLVTALPLSLSSSVFVRVDDERVDLMRALITGPSDTPYDSGCFEFDIYFPMQYPNTPPLVNLQTTGGGSVRFNPNLYNCGKVCLSLLGTWSGAEGETWNKDTSTLLQVLVSIQSLIFVPHPYFNEPGYERQIGTKNGEEQSRRYNENIRVATVEHAMIGQLKRPSVGFEDVIKAHFYLKQKKILKVVEKWLEEGKTVTGNNQRLQRAYEELKVELSKLTPPSIPEEVL